MVFYVKRIGDLFGVYRKKKLLVVVDYLLRDEIIHALIAGKYIDKRDSGFVSIIIYNKNKRTRV